MKAIRRKFDGERRTTRWFVNAKIGTVPYGGVLMDAKPVAGARRYVWAANGRGGYVMIDRILPDGSQVLCSWL